MKPIFLITTLMSAITLSACATPSHQAAMPPAELSNLKQSLLSEKPNVIISRKSSPPMALASRIKVDDREVARLMMGQYTAFYLEPGQHNIAVRYNPLSLQKGDDMILHVQEGQTDAFDITGNLSGYFGGGGRGSVKIKLTRKNPENLKADLERCCVKVELQPR